MSSFHTVCYFIDVMGSNDYNGTTGIVQLTCVLFLTLPNDTNDVLEGRH